MRRVNLVLSLAVFVVIELTGCGYKLAKVAPTMPSKMSEIAKRVDPKFAGTQSGYIMLSMQCAGWPPGSQPIVYAYGKFDVDLASGQFTPIEKPTLPPGEFKCPEVPKPSLAPAPVVPPVAPKK